MEALGTRPSQRGFIPRHSTSSTLFPTFVREVSGFNKRKQSYETIGHFLHCLPLTVQTSQFPTASSLRWSISPYYNSTFLDGLWHTSAAGRLRAYTSRPFAFPQYAEGCFVISPALCNHLFNHIIFSYPSIQSKQRFLS